MSLKNDIWNYIKINSNGGNIYQSKKNTVVVIVLIFGIEFLYMVLTYNKTYYIKYEYIYINDGF